MPGEAEAPLFAHAVGGDHDEVVLGGADLRRMLPGIGADGPVGGNGQDLRAVELHRPSRLGKAAIEADVDADVAVRRLEHRKRLVAEGVKAVDTEAKQVDLAIGSEDAAGRDDGRRVVDVVALALEQSHHHRYAQAIRGGGDFLRGRTRRGFRHWRCFLAAGETVAGERAFRKHSQLSPGGRRFLGSAEDLFEIALLLKDCYVHLHSRDSHQCSFLQAKLQFRFYRRDPLGSILIYYIRSCFAAFDPSSRISLATRSAT